MRSFRARLTLWNAVVIAIVLVAFSAGIVYANQVRLAANIDRELADRAMHGPLPPPRPGPAGGAPPGVLDDPNQPSAARQGQPGEGDLPLRFNDPAAIRFADVRRPRRFDSQGEPVGQMQDPPFDADSLRRSLKGESVYSDGEFDGEPIRIFSTPIPRGPNQGDVVQVASQTRELARMWSAQLLTLAFFLPGAILCAAVGAFFLTNRATQPIAKLKQAAEAINEQDLSRRLTIVGRDEFAELGITFNAMVERLEHSFRT